jgi:hypothetical protein
MSDYRRHFFLPGVTCFFTLATERRVPITWNPNFTETPASYDGLLQVNVQRVSGTEYRT